ncbi:hypothetical protein [Pseudonocardia sp. 73-21]|uniref:hypothetical protein n=1 Tax=Pseudonocardia sp. 73-21 TaxID=1895809 RepID=UPI0009689D5C|nr:hypothetical protein [Pseudonocardia sp. 73-21]OJY45944.1 MAG: hypothetical protein BGP03_31255 [Pseudonocardia sp. 73-21]
MTALGAPGDYAVWASWLDAFGRGEDLPDIHLTPVDERMGPHMQERLLRRVVAAFEARAQRWSDTLGRHLASGAVGRPAELAAALVAARGRLRPLHRLAADPRLPDAVRTSLAGALAQLLNSTQDSLERSARDHPATAQQLLSIVRANTLLAGHPVPSRPAGQALPPVGRRVIL